MVVGVKLGVVEILITTFAKRHNYHFSSFVYHKNTIKILATIWGMKKGARPEAASWIILLILAKRRSSISGRVGGSEEKTCPSQL